MGGQDELTGRGNQGGRPLRIAVVTGASSGLGAEYARAADAERAYDQIWVVARRRDRLDQLADQCATPVVPLTLDLGDPTSVQELAARLREASTTHPGGVEVGLLVCAAGLGKFATCDNIEQGEVDSMVDVNCRALVDVTQAALPYLGRGSRVIELASSAAFQPLPGLSVYAATKSFVLSYVRSLRFELRGRGIRVTAVCPTWVKTEFVKVARQTADGQSVRHPWPQISARRVVRWSLLVNRTGYPVATCGAVAFLMRIAGKVVPAPLVMWIWEGLRRI